MRDAMGDRQAAPASGCDWNPSVCSGARPCRAGRPRQAGRSGEGTAAGGQSHGAEVQSKGRGREGDAAREARGSGRGRAGRREDRGSPGPPGQEGSGTAKSTCGTPEDRQFPRPQRGKRDRGLGVRHRARAWGPSHTPCCLPLESNTR